MSKVRELYGRIDETLKGLGVGQDKGSRLLKESSDEAMKSLIARDAWYYKTRSEFNNLGKRAQAVNLLLNAITVATDGTPVPILPLFSTLKESGVVTDSDTVEENMGRVAELLSDTTPLHCEDEKEQKVYLARFEACKTNILDGIKQQVTNFIKLRLLELEETERIFNKRIKEEPALAKRQKRAKRK